MLSTASPGSEQPFGDDSSDRSLTGWPVQAEQALGGHPLSPIIQDGQGLPQVTEPGRGHRRCRYSRHSPLIPHLVGLRALLLPFLPARACTSCLSPLCGTHTGHSGEDHRLGRTAQHDIRTSASSRVTLGKPLHFSVPQFPSSGNRELDRFHEFVVSTGRAQREGFK